MEAGNKYVNGVLAILSLLFLAHVIFFLILLFNDWLYAAGVFSVILGCLLSTFYHTVVVSDWCNDINEYKFKKFRSRLDNTGSILLILGAVLLIWSSCYVIDDLFDGYHNALEDMGIPILGSLALSTFILGQLFIGTPLIDDMPERVRTETKIEYKKSDKELKKITQLEIQIDTLKHKLKKRKKAVNDDKKLLRELKEKMDELQSRYDYLAASAAVIIEDKERLEEYDKLNNKRIEELNEKLYAYEVQIKELRELLALEMRKNSEDWEYEAEEQEDETYETGYNHDETVNAMFSEFDKFKEEFQFDQKKDRYEYKKQIDEKLQAHGEEIFEQQKRNFNQREDNLKSKEELLYVMQYIKEIEGEIRILDGEMLHRDEINQFRLREAMSKMELERINLFHSLSNEIRDYIHKSKMSFQQLNQMIQVEGIERKNLESMTRKSFQHLSESFKEKVNRLETDVSYKFTIQGEKFANAMKESIYQIDRKIEQNDKIRLNQRYEDILSNREQRYNDLNGIKDTFHRQGQKMDQNERSFERQRYNDLSEIKDKFYRQGRKMDGIKANFDLALSNLEKQNLEGQHRTQLRLKDSEMQITKTLSTYAQNQMQQFSQLRLENQKIGFLTQQSKMAIQYMQEWMQNFTQNFKNNNALDKNNLLQEMLHMKQMVNKQLEIGQLKTDNDFKDVLFKIDDRLNKDAKILMMNQQIENNIHLNGKMSYEQRWNVQSKINDHQKVLSNLREEHRHSYDRTQKKDIESNMFHQREQIKLLQQQMR